MWTAAYVLAIVLVNWLFDAATPIATPFGDFRIAAVVVGVVVAVADGVALGVTVGVAVRVGVAVGVRVAVAVEVGVLDERDRVGDAGPRGDVEDAVLIGVEVLRRDVKFDPQLDPIVRVEATRLRRAIERYYSGPGADDPLTIVASRWRCSAC